MQLPINLSPSLQTTRWKAILDQTIAQVSDLQDQLNNLNNNSASSVMPSGSVTMFAGSTAPDGWLICDGSVVSQTTYAALFSVVGSTFNTGGEGSGNFRLPNFQRRVPVGAGGTGTGTLGNAIGNSGGAESVTLTTNEMPSHNHGGTTNNSSVPFNGFGNAFWNIISGNYQIINTASGSSTISGSSHAHTISSQGGGAAHNNIQPSLVVNYIIKT